ncbi:MAG: hypothetical protein IT548_00780 [Alphaproteobacteria bacterium]|nr:hypothetical protein [Alphaproteobacteria bacterium]
MGTILAFAVLAAVTLGAALLFVKEPDRTLSFYVIVGQLLLGEAVLFMLMSRSFIATARRGGASGVAQIGTYRLFLLAYIVSLAITISYFGFGYQRQGGVNDYIFAGIQVIVLGVPLFMAMMSETTTRFVEQDGRDAQAEARRGQRRLDKALGGIEDLVSSLPVEQRGSSELQNVELGMRTLRNSINSKLGLRGYDSRELADQIEDLESGFKRSLLSGNAGAALSDLAAQLTRAAQRL